MKKSVVSMLLLMLFFAVGCKPGDDPNNGNNTNDEEDTVIVNTIALTEITDSTAVSGATVIIPPDHRIVELGVCWSTSSEPIELHNHCSTDAFEDPFVCQLTGLTPGTTYHVRAYALEQLLSHYGYGGGYELHYGENLVVTTHGGGFNGHEYVDLGLPSGTLWATCNVGASTPEEYGNYYAWAETEQKSIYDWSTYKYEEGSDSEWFSGLSKYCDESSAGFNGYTDNFRVLMSTDDAATVNWGGSWRTPTQDEWDELHFSELYGITSEWTSQGGVDGELFIAPNGNRLFLPAAGMWYHDTIYRDTTSSCHYWSSTLEQTGYAWNNVFHCYGSTVGGDYRAVGQSIRPVCSSRRN